MNPFIVKKGLIALALVAASSQDALSGLVFTIEGPGVQTSSVAGVTTETFDSGAPTAGIGTYSGGSVAPADQFGGAFGTNYLDVTAGNIATLDLNSPQTYFGMWWSAGDASNVLSFFNGASLLASFQIGDIIPLLSPAYFGNPNPPPGRVTHEPFVYLNFTATGTDEITRIVFESTGGGGFESDNHSVTDRRITPPGTNPLPDSGVLSALCLALAGSIYSSRRRAS